MTEHSSPHLQWHLNHADLLDETASDTLKKLFGTLQHRTEKSFLEKGNGQKVIDELQEGKASPEEFYLLLCSSSEEDKKAIFGLIYMAISLMSFKLINNLLDKNLIKEETNGK